MGKATSSNPAMMTFSARSCASRHGVMTQPERFLSPEQDATFRRCAELLGVDPGPPGIPVYWEDVADPYDTDETQNSPGQ